MSLALVNPGWLEYKLCLAPFAVSALIFVLVLSGCVYAAKPAKTISLDSHVRNSIAAETEIRVVHFVPRSEIRRVIESGPNETLPVEDPLALVRDSFVDALESRFFRVNRVNFKKIPQPRLNNNLLQFKRTYSRGLLFSFHTTNWWLEPYWESRNLFYRLNYSVVGRLIRIEDQEVLWQKECQVIENDPFEKKIAYIDHQKTKFIILLTSRRKEIAEKCSVMLMENFMGI